jgi:hypothetical protein
MISVLTFISGNRPTYSALQQVFINPLVLGQFYVYLTTIVAVCGLTICVSFLNECCLLYLKSIFVPAQWIASEQ